MNRLSAEKRTEVAKMLTEGNSIRATARMSGVARQTVQDLVVDLGNACIRLMDGMFHGLRLTRIECDEIWSFVYSKQKNVPEKHAGKFGYGDVWTFTAIDAETKLIPCFAVGPRDGGTATEFMRDLASRLVNRVQLSTDGHRMYLLAVEDTFGADIDFGQIVKQYGGGAPAEAPANVRYSPAVCTGISKTVITGEPDEDLISTSYVERSNLTMRMSMRRFTRLTNGFSKKLANHVAAQGLFFAHYNLCRIHQTLRVTPAMAAGVTDRVWEVSELVALLELEAVVNPVKSGLTTGGAN